jgi:DnaK suppressor protein
MDKYQSDMASRFRAALLLREAHFAHTLALEPAAPNGDTVHEVGDFKDIAAQSSSAAVGETQAAHASAELAAIHAALRRLDDGSFGQCVDCGDAIDLRRLTALPEAACCAPCQEVHERAALA